MKRLAQIAPMIALAASLLAACSTYTTPGAGVPLGSIVGADVAEAMARQPAAVLPSRMAIVRVAAPGYYSRSSQSVGTGAFSVVTTRDIETDPDFDRLGRMPGVVAVAPVSRLLVPAHLGSVADLRASAAQLRADVVLIYTIDTRFRTESAELGPLQTVALGFLPSKKAIVTATCAFMIVDVRTGFIYGTGETTATQDQRTNFWGTDAAIEEARLRAEREAFVTGLGEIEKLWASVVREHG